MPSIAELSDKVIRLRSRKRYASGAEEVGAAGIAGVTPTGLNDGDGASIQAMLEGLRDLISPTISLNAIIKAPTASATNVIQPTAATVIPLTIRGFASQSAELLRIEDSANALRLSVSAAGNLSIAGNLSLTAVTAGAWNASVIGPTYGGTGLSAYAAGDLPYASAANTLARLGIGSAGQFLRVSSGVPAWSSLSSGDVTGALGYTPVNRAGDTMAGFLTLSSDPTSALHAATKSYVDALVAGVNVKTPVACATTANITLSGEQTIDGVATSASRVLVKDQSTASQNGIYVSASGSWTRATDMDGGSEAVGALVFVSGGTANANSQWAVSTPSPITIGSTGITWTLYYSAAAYIGGAGLTLSGLTFNVGTASASRIVVNANDIDLAASGITAGTYAKATYDAYGRATAGASLVDADIPSALTGKTYNALTLTPQAVGFTIAGGTSSRTLTVGGTASVSGTNTGDQTITLTGNVTGSGTGSFATTIAAGAVTLAMQANLAANSLMGNNTGSPATPLALSVAQVKTMLAISSADVSGLATVAYSGSASDLSGGTLAAARMPALTGDVTSSTGSVATAIANNVVTLAKFQQIATASILGRNTAATGNVEVLSGATVRGIIALSATDTPTFAGLSTTGNVAFGGTPTFASKRVSSVGTSFDGSSFVSENTGVDTIAHGRAFNFGVTPVSASLGRFDLTIPGVQTIVSWHASANVSIGSVTDNGYRLEVTGTLASSGLITAGAGINVTGTAGGGVGRLYYDGTDGISLRGNTGATNDFSVYSQNAGLLIANPTGTRNLTVGHSSGSVSVPGSFSLAGSAIIGSYLQFSNNAINAYSNITTPSIYATGNSGAAYPFLGAGNLVLEPRLNGATRDVVIMGLAGIPSAIVTGGGRFCVGPGPSAPSAIGAFYGGSGASAGLILATSNTDATTKEGRLKAAHYTNAEEPVTMVWASNQSAANAIYIGGNSSFENAATSISFYTAANTTTTTGTRRGGFNSSGAFDFTGAVSIAGALTGASATFGGALSGTSGTFSGNLIVSGGSYLDFTRISSTWALLNLYETDAGTNMKSWGIEAQGAVMAFMLRDDSGILASTPEIISFARSDLNTATIQFHKNIIGSINASAATLSAGATTIGGALSLASEMVFSASPGVIRMNTADGSDNGRVSIYGGGGTTSLGTRGAWVSVHGNEHSTQPGGITFNAGFLSTASINFYTHLVNRGGVDDSGLWSFLGPASFSNTIAVAGDANFYSTLTVNETASSSYGGLMAGSDAYDSLQISSNRPITIGPNGAYGAMFQGARLHVGATQTQPTSTIQSGGSVAGLYGTRSANSTIGDIVFIEITASSTQSLPAASSCPGRAYFFLRNYSGVGTAYIDRAGSDTMEINGTTGITSYPMTSAGKFVILVSNGINKWISFAHN